MDFNKRITSGVQKVPDFMIIYSVEGLGKSTFASKAPKPLFIDLEGGTKRIETKRVGDFTNLDEFWLFLNWFFETDHGYETLVLDSLSEFERMAWIKTCADDGADSIEYVGGGYAKGYVVALKQWDLLIQALRRIQAKRGTNIILIGHADVKTFTDPTTNSAYDRYQIKLHKHAAAFLRERVDFVGFANYEVTTKGKENQAKHKAYGTDQRILYTERRPAWDAKNRLGLPLQMPFEYAEYAKAAHADPQTKLRTMKTNIQDLITQVKDEKTAQAMRDFVSKIGDNLTDLAMIQEKIRQRLDEQEDKKDGK